MLMELDASTLLGFVIDPPTIRGVIAEAMSVISGPSSTSSSRLSTYTGSYPSSAPMSLDGADPQQEGDHDNVEESS